MQKQVAIPLALLFLPTVTTALFSLLVLCIMSHAGALPSPQPAWVHSCLVNQRLLARLWLVGAVGSLLNAGLTTLYFVKHEDPPATGMHAMNNMGLLFTVVAVFLILSLASLWTSSHTSINNPPLLRPGGSLGSSIKLYLPLALAMASGGVSVVLLVSATLATFLPALRCVVELRKHLKPLTPPPAPV